MSRSRSGASAAAGALGAASLATAGALLVLASFGSHARGTNGADGGDGPDGEGADPVPTFAEHIAPIVHRRCAECHHEGGSAPFPLDTYQDVRRRARQIVAVLRSGFMPPWKPEAGAEVFHDARRLGDEEIELFARWTSSGAPLGDPERVPEPPTFEGGWLLGEPDAVLEMPVPYPLQAEGLDVYRSLVLPTDFEETRYLSALDFRPDPARVVHHIITLLDVSASARAKDAADPEVGYEGMVAEGELFGNEVHGWGQGATPRFLPDGSAWELPPRSDLVLDTHFQTIGRPVPVKVSVGLYFADEVPDRPMANLSVSGWTLNIPPGMPDYRARGSLTLPVDVEIVSIQPHAHYVGKDLRVWAHPPSEDADDPDAAARLLIHIPDWDFNWQDSYRYRELQPLPAGTRIELDYVYDNSRENDRNPYDPPRRIVSGPRSSDEMSLLWLQVRVADEDADELRAALLEHHAEVQREARIYEEFVRGIILGFDRDEDGMLDEEEDAQATAYVDRLLEHPVHWAVFDLDRDGELDELERGLANALIDAWNGGQPVGLPNEEITRRRSGL